MHIVIPMSGEGSRFKKAGYKELKPLIPIDGKTIIEHIITLFPGESKFTFICNREHLKSTEMENILKKAVPLCNIVPIDPHKLGPVHAVTQVFNLLEDNEEVIVNYCDFFTYWNYEDFLSFTRNRNADGCVVAYRDFHPHMLGPTNYAFMRSKDQWMLEIQEKKPFTSNRMEEFASNGTYYFKNGEILKKYLKKVIENNDNVNGEFYASVVYNHLVKDNLKVAIYKVEHMLQWGTPDDFEEYSEWSQYFRDVIKYPKDKLKEISSNNRSLTLIPMAGLGKRFADEGYVDPKPLISVSGKPMIVQAVEHLPQTQESIFVCLEEHNKKYNLEKILKNLSENAKVVNLLKPTEGQAETVLRGLSSKINSDLDQPLFVGACDNGMLYDLDEYEALLGDPEVDVIVFSFKNHVSSKRNPQMYGWLKVDQNNFLKGVSVKKAISETPQHDNAIVGAFYFKKIRYFLEAWKIMQEKNIRVNNEFYVDSLMGILCDLGKNVKVFQVKHYVCWGTPNDYRTYNYWQSFFHKWKNHPYRLEKDPFVDQQNFSEIEKKYLNFKQEVDR